MVWECVSSHHHPPRKGILSTTARATTNIKPGRPWESSNGKQQQSDHQKPPSRPFSTEKLLCRQSFILWLVSWAHRQSNQYRLSLCFTLTKYTQVEVADLCELDLSPTTQHTLTNTNFTELKPRERLDEDSLIVCLCYWIDIQYTAPQSHKRFYPRSALLRLTINYKLATLHSRRKKWFLFCRNLFPKKNCCVFKELLLVLWI